MMTPPIPPALIATLTDVQRVASTQGTSWYLVGGLVRDQLLARPLNYLNVDLAVPSGALEASRQLAAYLHGVFVLLDEGTGTARIVVTRDGVRIELDVSDFRGATLEEDLGRRDFTVNAIAVALDDWLRSPGSPAPLIDPLHGREALAQRRLIACFSGTFEDDPVRILRAFRFIAQLGFTLDPAALPLMSRSVAGLARISGERIRDELLAIFDTDQAGEALRSLDRLGALDVLVPELSPGRGLDQGSFHHLDVLAHQLETVAQADRFLSDFSEFSAPLRQPLMAYCAEQLVERRSRKALIKLAGLIHDIGKPAHRTVEPDGEIWFLGHEQTGAALAVRVVERLRLSNRESQMVCQLVRQHLRPGFLSREPTLTRRALYRFFKELGDNGPACLLEWWADRMATRGTKSRVDQIDQQRSRLEEMIRPYFFQVEEVVKPPRLVNGNELMEMFKLTPGPRIGQLLGAVEEAQAEGRIRTKTQALDFIRTALKE